MLFLEKEQQTHQDGYPVVVEIGSCILKGLHSSREEKEGKDSCGTKVISFDKSNHCKLLVDILYEPQSP